MNVLERIAGEIASLRSRVAALERVEPGYAPASRGVTNGDLHDHSGGDGAPIPLDVVISGDIAVIATPNSATAITGASVTFTPAVESFVRLHFSIVPQNNTADRYMTFYIYEGTTLIAFFYYAPKASGLSTLVPFTWPVDNVSAAEHTWVAKWKNSQSGDQLQIITGRLWVEWYKT